MGFSRQKSTGVGVPLPSPNIQMTSGWCHKDIGLWKYIVTWGCSLSEFTLLPFHASVLLCLSTDYNSLPSSSFLPLQPIKHVPKPREVQMKHFGLLLIWSVISPTGKQDVLNSVRLPCFLIHCLPLDTQLMAYWRAWSGPLAGPLCFIGILWIMFLTMRLRIRLWKSTALGILKFWFWSWFKN